MAKRLLFALAFLMLISFGSARAQNGWLDLQSRYFSAGISFGEPTGLNLLTEFHFSNHALRLSGIYLGPNDNAPNGAELGFYLTFYQGHSVKHSIFNMAGFGQVGKSVSNLHTYIGYGYQFEWKSFFAQVRLPIYYINNDGYMGAFDYFKIGYVHDFR